MYVFVQHIINHLKEKYPGIEQLDVFTDGASSQFKQRFLFCNLYAWEQEHGFKIKWHFFATSHGKGVVDGLGGTVKRAVWRHIRSGQAHVSNPEEYAVVARERNPNIYIEYVSQSSIEEMYSFLDAKWNDVTAVPQTHKMHCYYPISSSQLMVAEISDATEFKVVSIYKSRTATKEDSSGSDPASDSRQSDSEIPHIATLSITIGQWVIVDYDEAKYPGEVISVDEDFQYEVNVMHPSGNHWKWPKTEDKIFYSLENIVKLISPPKAAGHRGQFIFEEQI